MRAQEDQIKPRSSELFDSETLEQYTQQPFHPTPITSLIIAREWDGMEGHPCWNVLRWNVAVSRVQTSAVKRSIGSTIGFHNHGEGPY